MSFLYIYITAREECINTRTHMYDVRIYMALVIATPSLSFPITVGPFELAINQPLSTPIRISPTPSPQALAVIWTALPLCVPSRLWT